jgi:ubiquinol-cytochrome c reductase cytochrome b subunit
MGIQVVSGLLIASALVAGADYAFNSIEYIIEALIGGRIIRFVHANFCSGVFFVMIVHLGKGLWFSSSSKSNL